MATAIAVAQGRRISHPRRHRFAWFLSMFVPRVGAGAGGAASLIVTIAIIGIIAAVAIPAYQEYQDRVRYTSAYSAAQTVQQQVTAYAYDNQAWPATMNELGYAQPTLSDLEMGYEVDVYENGLIGVEVGTDASGELQYIVLEPEVVEGEISWVCYGQNVKPKLLPPECS